MDGKIPRSVVQRPKQAYRAPIVRSFIGEDAPEYVNELLNESALQQSGIFDFRRSETLKKKLSQGASEVDNMALAAILSTQLLTDQFINNPKKSETDMSDCNLITQ